MAFPYEYFHLDNFQEPLNLTKEDFWSTLEEEILPDDKINCTQGIVKKFNLKTGLDLTMFYLQMDVLQVADVFGFSVQTSTEAYGINPYTRISSWVYLESRFKNDQNPVRFYK